MKIKKPAMLYQNNIAGFYSYQETLFEIKLIFYHMFSLSV